MEFLDDHQGRRQTKTNTSIYLYTQPAEKKKPHVSKAYTVDYLSNSYHCLMVHLKVL